MVQRIPDIDGDHGAMLEADGTELMRRRADRARQRSVSRHAPRIGESRLLRACSRLVENLLGKMHSRLLLEHSAQVVGEWPKRHNLPQSGIGLLWRTSPSRQLAGQTRIIEVPGGYEKGTAGRDCIE